MKEHILVPTPHPAHISLPVLKAIHAGVGFGSGTETRRSKKHARPRQTDIRAAKTIKLGRWSLSIFLFNVFVVAQYVWVHS